MSEHTPVPTPERILAAVASRLSDRGLERLIGRRLGLRAIFDGMTAAYRPEVANGLRGAIRYDLRNSRGRRFAWTVWIGDTAAIATPGAGGDPLLTLHILATDFIRVAAGELDPVELMRQHRLHVDGDGLAAARLRAMFGRAAPPDLYRAPMTPEMLVQ